MTYLQVKVDDTVKQEADRLFNSLGMDTATAVRIFLQASIFHKGIPFPVRNQIINHDSDLMEAITDSRKRRNLHGPFATASEAVESMLED